MWSVVKSVALGILFALLLPATEAAASPRDLLAAGRVDDAIASLQAQLKSSPNDAASYNYLCRAYFALADWDHAVAACEKSVALAPDSSDYHLWLGRAYGEKADRVNPFSAASLAGKVRREFERAVQLNPRSVEARADLAEFYLDAPGIVGGGQDKARAQAAALGSLSQAKAHYVNGRIAEKNKDRVAAEKEYRAAIEDSKGNANDWLNLALFYKHINQFENMEQALEQAANARTAQNEVLVECAEILLPNLCVATLRPTPRPKSLPCLRRTMSWGPRSRSKATDRAPPGSTPPPWHSPAVFPAPGRRFSASAVRTPRPLRLCSDNL